MATESSPFDTEVSTRKTSVSQRKQIIAIANSHISGRKLGAPLTNMALSILRDKSYEHTDYHLHYYSINVNGKDLRSSTFFIKDSGKQALPGTRPLRIVLPRRSFAIPLMRWR